MFVTDPLVGDWDAYYVPTKNPDPYPPPLESYLRSPEVTSKIGSQGIWSGINYEVLLRFDAAGDWVRSSPITDLEMVINSGVSTVMS